MAILSGTGVPLRLDQFNVAEFLEGDILSRSSTSLNVDYRDGTRDVFTGSGILYDSVGTPRSGTLTGFTGFLGETAVVTITGLNYSIMQFVTQAENDDTPGALEGLFSGNDNMTGTSFDDFIIGFDGHDNIFGGAGTDTLAGADGNDHIYGQSANGGQDGADAISAGAGSDYVQGNAGNDLIDGGDGSDRVQAGQGDDEIEAGRGNDTVNGNLGNDVILGDEGNDSLRGGQGSDSIAGGSGNDVISGDLGADLLVGESGADLFIFAGAGSTISAPDRITDFTDGVDHMAIGFIPAVILRGAQSSASTAATLAQQFFDQNAGNSEVAAIAVGSDTYIFYASNGGITVDSAVLLLGFPALAVSSATFQ